MLRDLLVPIHPVHPVHPVHLVHLVRSGSGLYLVRRLQHPRIHWGLRQTALEVMQDVNDDL